MSWYMVLWALFAWGAVAGSMLILFRSRHAVAAFAVSLFPVVTLSFYVRVFPPDSPMYGLGTGALPVAICVPSLLGVIYYARRQTAAGILR